MLTHDMNVTAGVGVATAKISTSTTKPQIATCHAWATLQRVVAVSGLLLYGMSMTIKHVRCAVTSNKIVFGTKSALEQGSTVESIFQPPNVMT